MEKVGREVGEIETHKASHPQLETPYGRQALENEGNTSTAHGKVQMKFLKNWDGEVNWPRNRKSRKEMEEKDERDE